jgi:uncharacterized protein (UPF0335 family)
MKEAKNIGPNSEGKCFDMKVLTNGIKATSKMGNEKEKVDFILEAIRNPLNWKKEYCKK